MQSVSFYKRILSYFYPVRIRKSSSRHHTLLELFLYRGQYQLGTVDVLYSDGRRYRPLVVAFKDIMQYLPQVKEVLLLGSGIGSAIQILSYKGVYPHYTLVDNDDTILAWAKELQHANLKIQSVWEDAEVFMQTALPAHYNLLVVDIFTGRVVPQFATQQAFLQQCRRSILPGGYFVMNYIVNPDMDWNTVLSNIKAVFPQCRILEDSINRIIVSQV